MIGGGDCSDKVGGKRRDGWWMVDGDRMDDMDKLEID